MDKKIKLEEGEEAKETEAETEKKEDEKKEKPKKRKKNLNPMLRRKKRILT